MSTDGSGPSRGLSLNIPQDSSHSPYCPQRPTLREILANTSEPPWTLSAFTAYLSNNHCLETLEFTMDAGRYRRHYEKMIASQANGTASGKEREYMKQLWLRLMEAYIQPSGTREVNLHSDVRDPLLRIPQSAMPPPPSTLDNAVAKIYELMEESVLVSFLESVCPGPVSAPSPQLQYYQQSHSHLLHPHQHQHQHHSNRSAENLHDDRSSSLFSRRNWHARKTPSPPHSSSSPQASNPPYVGNRFSAPAARPYDRFSSSSSHSSSSSTAGGGINTSRLAQTTSSPTTASTVTDRDSQNLRLVFSDDRNSGTSDPRSPTTSGESSGLSSSPKRDSGMWRKLGRLSGMGGMSARGGSSGAASSSSKGVVGRKRSEGGLREDESWRG